MKKRMPAGLLALCIALVLGMTACSGGGNAPTATTPAAEDDAATTTTSAAKEGEEATTTDEGGEETTPAEAAAPATWENLSWEKDTSPVTFSCYIDHDWYAVDTWGEDEVSKEITRLTGFRPAGAECAAGGAGAERHCIYLEPAPTLPGSRCMLPLG